MKYNNFEEVPIMDIQQPYNQLLDFQKFSEAMMKEDNVLLGISELSHATGVTPAQLRYWVSQGYIKNYGSNKKNKFSLETVFMVRSIKIFQNQGYTLSASAKRAAQYSDLAHKIRKMFIDRVINVSQNDGQLLINLGVFDAEPTQNLIARIDDEGTKFDLI